MVPYKELAVGDPLAFAFARVGLDWVAGLVAATGVIAIAGILLVYQLGQPRIWMTMSRDGLLPARLAAIHPKYRTPSFATIVTGLIVGLPLIFTNLHDIVDLTSVGTLFAFCIVCGGILYRHYLQKCGKMEATKGFKVPYIEGKWILPLVIITIIVFIGFNSGTWNVESLLALLKPTHDTVSYWSRLPFYLFMGILVSLVFMGFRSGLSLIPALGLITCFYLMTELHIMHWVGFSLWMVIGLILYFFYGFKHSKQNNPTLN
jgi:amino acid transporter